MKEKNSQVEHGQSCACGWSWAQQIKHPDLICLLAIEDTVVLDGQISCNFLLENYI